MLYPQRYSELNPTPPAGMPGGLKPSVSVRQSLKPRPRIRIPMVRGRRDESGVLGARGARAPRGDDHAQRGARGRAWIERGGRRAWPSPASIRAALETLSLKRRSPRQSRGLRRLSDPKGIRTFRQRLRAGGMSAIPGADASDEGGRARRDAARRGDHDRPRREQTLWTAWGGSRNLRLHAASPPHAGHRHFKHNGRGQSRGRCAWSDPKGIRTPVLSVRGICPEPG